MFTKTLIAAATVATGLALIPATQAEAKTNIDINVGLFGGYGGYGYYDPGYPAYYNPGPNYISCKKGKKILDYQKGFNNVQAFDCSLPGYKYTAWKNGHKFVVRLNGHGHITAVNKLF